VDTEAAVIVIATRKSPLALWQAERVRVLLLALHPHLGVGLLPMVTEGDRRLGGPLSQIGGKGLFIKELEEQLLAGKARLAVHSMKDVTVDLPEGLVLGAIMAREDPRDVFVSHRYASLAELPPGAVVGTASLRRRCQLLKLYPDLVVRDLRGNVGTRLAKVDALEYDGALLAAAGMVRLGLAARIRSFLPTTAFLPAVGQGAMGIECRADDAEALALVAPLNDPVTAACVGAERAFNSRLGGSCQIPVAGYASCAGETLRLRVRICGRAGEILEDEGSGRMTEPVALGEQVAAQVFARGADRLLAEWSGLV
jgi:hydroxymethylbilane synthase